MAKDRNIIFEDSSNLYVRSTTDNLYILPWRLLHDGYEVSRQEGVVSVSPDSGIPISHSRFSITGRIIAAKIYVNTEPDWWTWYRTATRDRALPFWIYDIKVRGFARCYITEQPKLSPADSSPEGCFVTLSLFIRAEALSIKRLINEGTIPRLVVEGTNKNYVFDTETEVSY